MEAFVERTDSWLEHVGRWRVTVSHNGNIKEGGKDVPYFVLLVHLDSQKRSGGVGGGESTVKDGASDNEPSSSSSRSKYSATRGFVVTRRLNDFHRLHKKLQPLVDAAASSSSSASTSTSHLAENRLFKLPSPGFFERDTSEKYLERAMVKLQGYVTTVMTDHVLSHSEAVYEFCCPTPEFLVGGGGGGGKRGGKRNGGGFYYGGLGGFGTAPGGAGSSGVGYNAGNYDLGNNEHPFSGIKRALSSMSKTTHDDDDHQIEDPHEFLVQEDLTAGADGHNNKKLTDSFAEPLYRFVAEIFELRGVFKIFRQSLITFVRVAFGKSINKQLRYVELDGLERCGDRDSVACLK